MKRSMESNQEQKLVDKERAFEESKAARLTARHRWEAAKGRFHMELVAKREAGQNWTIADMKAMEASAIDDVHYVKEAYLAFIDADSRYRSAKVAYEDAKRSYWDSKPIR